MSVHNSIFDADQLKKRLIEEDVFIGNLIDTIPPKIYFDDNEVLEMVSSKKHAAMDEAVKAVMKGNQELSSRNKHKRARLDPNQHKSVTQIQQEVENTKRSSKKKGASMPSVSLARAANIEELRNRLEMHIQQLQSKRRGCNETEFQEKKRLRKRMKRQEKARQKGNMNKMQSVKDQQIKNGVLSSPKHTKNVTPKPVYNKEGRVIYSKFDFMNSGEYDSGKKSGKKNYKKLLESAEKNEEKIENMKKEDPESANVLVKKKLWQQAIQKAEGVKLKDDPTLLKKTMKRQEKRKNKSSKEWKNRVDHTEKMKMKQQEKRKDNLQKRKKEKLDKKIKRAKKKGRIIPGF